jgi:tetratricopeptide (TPR) repeat protein
MKSLEFKKFSVRSLQSELFILCLLLCISRIAYAQSERKFVRDGNKLYKEKRYSDAEVNYKKSLNVNKNSSTGQFNLGDAYYKQGKFEDAAQQFQPLTSNRDLSKDEKAKAFHNLGNSFLQAKKYDESINAYKNALKINSKDNDTRYNLAYAQSMLQQQKQQSDKDKKNQNKDQQKQQQKKDQQKQEQKQAEQKQKISKEDAEKILQALNNDEKNTQKKLMRKESTKISIEKNW